MTQYTLNEFSSTVHECPAPTCDRGFESRAAVTGHYTSAHDGPFFEAEIRATYGVPAEWLLETQYTLLERPTAEIAELLGVAGRTIARSLEQYGIETRGIGEARRLRREYRIWHDESTLDYLYTEREYTSNQIADRFGGTASNVVNELHRRGIPVRDRFEWVAKKPLKLRHSGGYEYWGGGGNSSNRVYVHQLTVIAEGADPYAVFDSENHVHHKNGVKWDNRPSNLELLPQSEHQSGHMKKVWDSARGRD